MPGTAEGAAKARLKKIEETTVIVEDTLPPSEGEDLAVPEESAKAKEAADARIAARYGGRARALDTNGTYVVGFRPLKVGDRTLQPGEPIDVTDFPRLESWLNTGRIRRAS